jgi:hypothetical protein
MKEARREASSRLTRVVEMGEGRTPGEGFQALFRHAAVHVRWSSSRLKAFMNEIARSSAFKSIRSHTL